MIDVSGDGPNNDGLSPGAARRTIGTGGLTINALVVGGDQHRLWRYYHEQVIHGRHSFVELARDHRGFAEAMRRKLLREIGPVAARRPGRAVPLRRPARNG